LEVSVFPPNGKSARRLTFVCIAACSVTPAFATTLKKSIPVDVTFSKEGKPTWLASTPDLTRLVPILNAGDRLRIEDVQVVSPVFGVWQHTFSRFSHESCHTSWFQKKCTKYWAQDQLTYNRRFDPFGSDVDLKIEFTSALQPDQHWRQGQFALRDYRQKWIVAEGPLEMKIVGAVAVSPPSIADFKPGPQHTPVGNTREVRMLGSNGPERWLNVTVEFEAAPLAPPIR
jgi:hypothetical protein